MQRKRIMGLFGKKRQSYLNHERNAGNATTQSKSGFQEENRGIK